MPLTPIYEHVCNGFRNSRPDHAEAERRIGAELKFPLVNDDGTAASLDEVDALWGFLQEHGWAAEVDPLTNRVIGARTPGERNDTVASCETGYCKTEFSLAHTGNLHDLDGEVHALKKLLSEFSVRRGVLFLGYGIQPVTAPSQDLLMKKSRTSVWGGFYSSNRHIPEEDGDDVHLFTVNAASHVHVSVSRDEAVNAVNVLNGFAGAQIALTAHSNVWRGQLDPEHKCVNEVFWDWWMPDSGRVGVPEVPFRDLRHYVHTIAGLKPVYVKRDGRPIVLPEHGSFADYFTADAPVGQDVEGGEVRLIPETADFDLHSTCYWYNARISRYYTVENRVNDQQPPEALVGIAALTLGLVSAQHESKEELGLYRWQDLRSARESACRNALKGTVDGLGLSTLSERMVEIAEMGLQRRGLGEEVYLEPFRTRLRAQRCPADEASELFKSGGIGALLSARKL